MALTGALCTSLLSVVGFTNKTLRGLVSQLLDGPYTRSQMTYDLRRLRLLGLIQRLPRSNTYVLTPDGQRVAITYTKLGHRLFPPLLAADRPPAPVELRAALRTIDHHVEGYLDRARLRTAA
jgi:predicted MarR family transcription regulator